MNHLLIIKKQVNTASTLICQNDRQKPFISAAWFRINSNFRKLLKNQNFTNKTQCIYNCSIFDYDARILLELKNNQGDIKEYLYGPIKFDKKVQLILHNLPNHLETLPVIFTLNKNKKIQGLITFTKILSDIITINIKIQHIEIQIQQPIFLNWGQYQQIFLLEQENPLQISISLGRNKLLFVKALSKIKIYSHSGNYLCVNFVTHNDKIVFLARLYMLVQLNKNFKQARYSQKQSSIYMNQSLRISQINNLFTSTDWGSDTMAPHPPIEHVLDDFRNIVFTPKPQLDREIREKGFPSYQSFIGSDQSNETYREGHKDLKQSNRNFQNLQTNQTIKAIKQQQVQQETEAKNKTPRAQKIVRKPHQIINQFNKNRRHLQTYRSKQRFEALRSTQIRPLQKIFQKPSYQKICERNAFLQQQNRNLLLENIKLKHKIQVLQNQNKRAHRSKQPMPPFLKVRDHDQKKYLQNKLSKQKKKKLLNHTQYQSRTKNLKLSKLKQLGKGSNNFHLSNFSKIYSNKSNFSACSPRSQAQ